MKKKQVNELYKKMKPKELARLAIDAVGRGDEKELDIINDSVEIRTYDCPHKDYQFFLNGFESLCLYYCKEYWRMNAIILGLRFLPKPYTNKIDEVISQDDIDEAIGGTYKQLDALELALIEVCQQNQVSIETVKKMTDTNILPSRPMDIVKPDEKLVKHYKEFLSNCLGVK
jgi:hypothetical protein